MATATFKQSRISRLSCILMGTGLLLLSLTACSYQLGADRPSIIGDGTKTLKVKEVDYPTLHPWIPNAIRSSLRDEVTARKLAAWVDSGTADYEIAIKVTSYTAREAIRDYYDRSVLFDTQMTLVATVYDGRTNKAIWTSGSLSYSEQDYQSVEGQRGAQNLIRQITRKLADHLRNAF